MFLNNVNMKKNRLYHKFRNKYKNTCIITEKVTMITYPRVFTESSTQSTLITWAWHLRSTPFSETWRVRATVTERWNQKYDLQKSHFGITRYLLIFINVPVQIFLYNKYCDITEATTGFSGWLVNYKCS